MSKKCGCKIITFGDVNWYFLLIILGALFNAAKELITSRSNKLGEINNKNDPTSQHPIIITIIYSLGLCLSFIFFIIYKKCNKSNNITNFLLFSKKSNRFNINKEISKKEKFLWILLCSILDFIANVIYSFNWLVNEENYLSYWSSNIVLMSLFSLCLLKMKLYKHHYLSIAIITIFGMVYNFISENLTLENISVDYKGYIIYLFAEGIFNTLYVLYKFLMIKKFIKSYSILFFQGLIELILGIITLVIATYYFQFDSFRTYFEDIDGREIFIAITLIFTNFITFLTIYIVIDLFTPFHIFLENILTGTIIGCFDGTLNSDTITTITYLSFILIAIFMILIFIEIIQLNFCGLSTMTKKNIEERAKLDSILSIEDNDEEDNDFYLKDKDERTITCGEYTFELEEINKNNFGQILDSDVDSNELNK